MFKRFAAAIALALITSQTCAGSGAAHVDGQLLADEANGKDWASYGRTYSENHYSPLTEISRASIGRLGLSWAADLDVMRRPDSQPLAADGVLYVATGLSVVQAFDAATGRRLWRYDPNVAAVATVAKLVASWGIRGLALWKGHVYAGTQDGRLLALNAKTGKLLWSTQTLEPKADQLGEATITGAPRVFNDKVVIGSAGADRWARGALSCFDARTGKLLWRFYTVPGNPADGFENEAMRMAARTWSGEWWKYGPGGTVWNAITYDPDLNRVYLGTGNGGPWNWRIRNPAGGDALFLASIVALNADTGEYVWHYQQNPNEAWDYNAAMDMILATIDVAGAPRKVLMQAPKNGFYYVIDRTNGKLLAADPFAKVTWAERIDLTTGRPVEKPGVRYENGGVLIWPGFFGAHNWQPMSYSPATRLAYIPTLEAAEIYSAQGIDAQTWRPLPHQWNSGLAVAPTDAPKAPVEEYFTTLQAWDPVRQKRVWQVKTPSLLNGGTMATAGGLVFQGHMDGTFNAYDATNGARLWRFAAGVAVLGAPISYAVGGHQYVSVLIGPPATDQLWAVPFGWQYRDHPRRLLTFALGGRAKLPATAPPRLAKPLRSESFKADAALAAAGEGPFSELCSGCHGTGAVSAGSAPDLRESAIPLDRAAFTQIVHGGGLLLLGMPRFDFLDEKGLEAVRHYIRWQAERGTSADEQRPRGP